MTQNEKLDNIERYVRDGMTTTALLFLIKFLRDYIKEP
jgi:uncharacterized protein YeeX (DUF496 family)